MALGAGYDIDKFQVKSSALTDLKTARSSPETAINTEYEFHVIRTEEELSSQIESSANGSCSATPLFSLDASSTYLRSIKCSAKSMTTIIRCTITSCSLETVSNSQLSEDAKQCLKKPPFHERDIGKFCKHYSQYYISGKKFQSTFVAVCTHTAKSEEQLDKLSFNGKSAYKFFKLDLLLDLVRKVTSSGVETKVNFKTTGTKTAAVSTSIAASDLEGALQDFRLNYIPVPQAAILTHYSNLIPRKIQGPDQRPLIQPAFHDAYRDFLGLERQAAACLLDKFSAVQLKLAVEKSSLCSVRPSSNGWQKILAQAQQNLLAIRTDLDDIFATQKVVQHAFQCSAKIDLDHWCPAEKNPEWTFGFTGEDLPVLQSQKIMHMRQEYAKGLHTLSCGNRIIIGLRIESLRLDGHNGAWKLKTAGLGQTQVQVEFSANLFSHDRAWAVEAWTVHVDEAKLRKGCTWQ